MYSVRNALGCTYGPNDFVAARVKGKRHYFYKTFVVDAAGSGHRVEDLFNGRSRQCDAISVARKSRSRMLETVVKVCVLGVDER